MASLQIRTEGFHNQVLELRPGINSCGRSPACHLQIEHATVSGRHCELLLSEGGLRVRDCDSTNGTFIQGERIREAMLSAGQTLRLGDVELLVETTDIRVAIPYLEPPVHPAPPVVLPDGSLMCPQHSNVPATCQCTHCREIMCDVCVHRLRRRGGRVWKLCPRCSNVCEPIGGEKKKKKSLLDILHKTVKLPFISSSKSGRRR